MKSITFSQAEQDFDSVLDMCEKYPIEIKRENKESVVLISLSDYKSMEGTLHLMKSSNNSLRLNSAISELEKIEIK